MKMKGQVTGQECLTSPVGREGIKHLTPCEGKNTSPCGLRWGKVHTDTIKVIEFSLDALF